jgi:23S rRNA (uracil1939-C5)-methyltransferase
MIGFYAPRSHDIIDIASCPIANSGLNGVLKAVKCWMESYSIPPYQEETHTGLVRHVMARASRQGGVMAVIVINGQDLPREKELLEALQREVPTLQSLCLSVHTARSNVILGDSYRVLWGQERLEDSLCGLNFSLSPLSFFQINPEQTEVLYKLALEFASLSGTETVADVYCGAGTISLLLAKRARRVIGLETVEAAVCDARENALKNGIGNVEFLLGQAEVLLPKLVEEGLRPDVIVLDPPRKGVEPPVIEAIALAQPKRVVYVSCNPATQARDAALFFEKGYRITRCQPVDMFCWTHGVENVLCFDTTQG